MSRSYEYSNQQSTAYATICERRPFFSEHRNTIYILLNSRGAPDFLGAYHGLFLSLFLGFLSEFFSCWCE